MAPRTRASTAPAKKTSPEKAAAAEKTATRPDGPQKAAAKASGAAKASAEDKGAPRPTAPSKAVAKSAGAKAAATPTRPTPNRAKASPAKSAPVPEESTAAKSAPAAKKAVKRPAPGAPARPSGPAPSYRGDDRFLEHQRQALLSERATYLEQAQNLQAEALSLVEEMEPGDVQFDEESGEGGTVTVDRERDLALSAQALAAVEEIDAALDRIATGRYGVCESCGELIGKPRLEALPYARLCIACKSGGLSRR